MGCLNSDNGFKHWFGNIHLSGPCNRKCYFCIGQHMMGLDGENNLGRWPLLGLTEFVKECERRDISEVNITGTNTDPALYKYHGELTGHLRYWLPGVKLGIRTNGVALPMALTFYDKLSISVCSLDPKINGEMMGGPPADVRRIITRFGHRDLKVNVILGPENTRYGDVFLTLARLAMFGIKRVNLREPYGQPHVGNPLAQMPVLTERLGMPVYGFAEMDVTYWDVHYVEVESVNLYASGRVSTLYPISAGYDPELGVVMDQSKFPGGRIREQWVTIKS